MGLDGLDHSSAPSDSTASWNFQHKDIFSPIHQNIKFKWRSQLPLIKIDDVIQKADLNFSCPNALTSGSNINFLLVFGLEKQKAKYRLRLSVRDLMVIMNETGLRWHISL